MLLYMITVSRSKLGTEEKQRKNFLAIRYIFSLMYFAATLQTKQSSFFNVNTAKTNS